MGGFKERGTRATLEGPSEGGREVSVNRLLAKYAILRTSVFCPRKAKYAILRTRKGVITICLQLHT